MNEIKLFIDNFKLIYEEKILDIRRQIKGKLVPKMSFTPPNDCFWGFGKKSPVACQKV